MAPPPSRIERLPTLKVETVKQREKEALESMKKQLSRIGKDVTPEAQSLFDELSKTYDCKWNAKQIELQQLGVEISPPYTPADCKGETFSSRISSYNSTINAWVWQGRTRLHLIGLNSW